MRLPAPAHRLLKHCPGGKPSQQCNIPKIHLKNLVYNQKLREVDDRSDAIWTVFPDAIWTVFPDAIWTVFPYYYGRLRHFNSYVLLYCSGGGIQTSC
jgi:hypothetical protein